MLEAVVDTATSPIVDLADLPDRENAEGYVVQFRSAMRVKVKHPRYVAIHRALNDLTEHHAWEMLRLSDSVDEQLELVPDESYRWLDTAKSNLEQQFSDAPSRAQHEFDDIMTTSG